MANTSPQRRGEGHTQASSSRSPAPPATVEDELEELDGRDDELLDGDPLEDSLSNRYQLRASSK